MSVRLLKNQLIAWDFTAIKSTSQGVGSLDRCPGRTNLFRIVVSS